MSKKEQVAIVGAGIAGIAAAKFEMDKGNDVILIEAGKQAGGLLKSDSVDGYHFDYGTHIIPETGLAPLDELLFGEVSEEEFSVEKLIAAGNYFNGSLNEKNCYVDTSTLTQNEYNQGCYDLINANITDAENLEDWYIGRYGKTFTSKVFAPVVKKYIGEDAKDLAPVVGNFFDMSRLLAFDQETTTKLSVIDQYAEVLGHHVRGEGVKKYYPKEGGVGVFVDHLLKKIDDNAVNILLETMIESIVDHNGTVSEVVTNKGTFKVDRLIWTIPVALIARYVPLGIHIEKPKFRSTSIFDFAFKQPLASDATFINVYDVNLHAGRITLYQNLTKANYAKGTCTVEVLSDNQDLTEGDILAELVEMGLVADASLCTFKRKRHIPFGFPILDLAYAKKSKTLSEAYQDHFKNVSFIGKGSEKAFFMTDVLKEAYTSLVGE